MKKFSIVIALFLLFLFSNSYSQTEQNSIFAPSLNIYPGYILRNYKNVAKSNVAIISSINLGWQTNGKDAWHKFYNYPIVGIEGLYTNFGNNKELGHGFGLIPVLQIKSRKLTKNWNLKFGMGVTYLTTPYNIISNPNNLYYGGNFANMTIANISWVKAIGSKKTSLVYGFSSIHCSNGHNALPNAGANMLLFNLGYKWNTLCVKYYNKNEYGFMQAERAQRGIHQVKSVIKINKFEGDSLVSKNKFNYSLKFGLGTHEFGETTKATGGPLYPSYHSSFFLGKQYKNVHIVQAGITYSFYTSFYDYIISQEVYKTQQKLKASTVVLFIGHEFIMGKISFSTQFGIYAYNPFFIQQKKIDGSWSKIGQKLEAINTNRLGLIFYPFKKHNTLNNVKNQLSLGIFIKANLGQADLFEYTIGYTF